jgi:hypothetical protein
MKVAYTIAWAALLIVETVIAYKVGFERGLAQGTADERAVHDYVAKKMDEVGGCDWVVLAAREWKCPLVVYRIPSPPTSQPPETTP